MASYGDMRDAYRSIYESKEEKWPSITDKDAPHKKIKETPVKRYPTGWQPTNAVKEALDVLLDSGIIDEETHTELMEREVIKNPYPSPHRPHTPLTKDQMAQRKAGQKKLMDRKYFDSPRD
jgi:hypothetical protein